MAAALLARRFDEVRLITHREIAREELESALNIDLSGIDIQVIPALPPNRFADFTAQFDLFVNASFMTSQPSGAARSMLLVLFPSPIDRGWTARLRQRVGRLLVKQLLLPRWLDGFYDVQELGRGWFRYATDRAQVRLQLPPGSKTTVVEIIAGNFRAETPLPVRCLVDGELVAARTFDPSPGNFELWPVQIDRVPGANDLLDLTLESPVHNPAIADGDLDNREVGLAVTDVRVRHPRRFIYELVFRRFFRELGLRLEGLPDYGSLDFLDTYDVIAPISEFSRSWMQHYWNRDGPLLFPPVDTSWAAPSERDQAILGVGRFFRGSHEKKHRVMIDEFIQMRREGLEGWTLHLVGQQSGRDIDLEYTKDLQRRAAGHPIEFHINAPFEDLRRLYGGSRVYWHAAGHGEREARNPVRFEHFGITVVEAMASGTVPVVIDHGALPEIISHGVDGFRWSTTRELRQHTWALVTDDDLWKRMSEASQAASHRFNVEAFDKRLNALVDDLGFKGSPSG
jgi:glycosyltransferase involved in cell wall biosynthesis